VRLIGIDEAGRGPVIGPMVMAVIVISLDCERKFLEFGVRDSKLFGSGVKAHPARLAMRVLIEEHCITSKVLEIEPDVIDAHVSRGRLDDLEREGALQLLKDVGATSEDRIVCDGEPIFGCLTEQWPNLLAENRADARHASVAAASILAKTRRDERMEVILRSYEPEFGRIGGGGYVNEPTRRFLEAYEASHGCLPSEVRQSWTWRRPVAPVVREQPDISSFFLEDT
jgi:ribonuclease HII